MTRFVPSLSLSIEVIGAVSVLIGIGMIYLPAALIVGGALAVFAAQGVTNDTAG